MASGESFGGYLRKRIHLRSSEERDYDRLLKFVKNHDPETSQFQARTFVPVVERGIVLGFSDMARVSLCKTIPARIEIAAENHAIAFTVDNLQVSTDEVALFGLIRSRDYPNYTVSPSYTGFTAYLPHPDIESPEYLCGLRGNTITPVAEAGQIEAELFIVGVRLAVRHADPIH